jgi:hypothetical protein
MPRLRQNDCDGPVDMVQAGMTHHAVADHFNVSRIIIENSNFQNDKLFTFVDSTIIDRI